MVYRVRFFQNLRVWIPSQSSDQWSLNSWELLYSHPSLPLSGPWSLSSGWATSVVKTQFQLKRVWRELKSLMLQTLQLDKGQLEELCWSRHTSATVHGDTGSASEQGILTQETVLLLILSFCQPLWFSSTGTSMLWWPCSAARFKSASHWGPVDTKLY